MNAPTLNGADGDNVTLGHNMFCIAETVYTNRERGTRMHRAIFSTKQISGVVTLVILNCLHEQGARHSHA